MLSIAVVNSDGAAVRTLPSSLRGAGLAEIAWDVRDASGTRPIPGSYRAVFSATDTGGNTSTATTSVRVRN